MSDPGAMAMRRGVAPLPHTAIRFALGLAASLVPLVLLLDDSYWLNIIAYAYLFAGLAVAWNIIGGFGGQFSLGHGVFFALGAYMTAQCYMLWGVSPWLGILPGAAVSAILGPLIFWPTFRLKGPFFAIATLAFNEVAFVMANYFESATGGPRGLQVPYKVGFFNMIFADRWLYAILMFAFMAGTIGAAIALMRGRLGYYLLAVREDEDAARAAGIDVLAVKLKGTALSAALIALGGGLYAMYVRTIEPISLFSLPDIGVKFALLSLIGGIGTIAGPVLGAFLIVPLESYLRAILGGAWPGTHLIVLGMVMVLASLFMKHGVVGAATWLWRHIKRARAP